MNQSGTRTKDQLLASYLKQQQTARTEHNDDDEYDEDGEDDDGNMVAIPSNEDLEDFKNKVRMWLEYDNTVIKLKQALKERKKAQDALTGKIGEFMSKYNIEDLNTKQGKLRCRIIDVKAPLTQKQIKERLTETLTSGDKQPNEVVNDVFKREGTIQKIVLRRLKRGGAMNI